MAFLYRPWTASMVSRCQTWAARISPIIRLAYMTSVVDCLHPFWLVHIADLSSSEDFTHRPWRANYSHAKSGIAYAHDLWLAQWSVDVGRCLTP